MTRARLAPSFLLLAGTASAAAAPRVLVARWTGPITPVSAEFVDAAVAQAGRDKDAALVLELDTPGGLDGAMRESVKTILASPVPVIAFVSPAGARAASAGVFLVSAANVAAMTPGTNIGAAHPIELGGAPSGAQGAVMGKKVANDAAAYLAAIAARRGRNADWARFVVQQSSSITAEEAVRERVVDLTAEDLPDLLAKVDGRKIASFPGRLRTKGAVIERYEPSARQRLLMAVADPNVAMILMTLGVSGLLIELYHPGLILPGVVGLVCLISAFYAFQALSASLAGVLLMLAGMLFLVLEMHVVSYGLLAAAGLASILLGAAMMFRAGTGLAIGWKVLAGTVGGFAAVFGALTYTVARALAGKPRAGAAAMIGRRVTATTGLAPRGTVSYGGELWRAQSLDGSHPAGAELEVVAVRDLTLEVRAPR